MGPGCVRLWRRGLPPRDPWRRAGMTLVEVMVAVLLLGSAMTGILVAQARSLRQIHEAGSQMAASQIARELIANWRVEGADVTAAASGAVADAAHWSWTRTSERRSVTDMTSMAEIVLLLEYRSGDRLGGKLTYEYRWLTHEPKKP